MSLQDQAAADFAAIASGDELGETVTYRPAAGGSYSIQAVVYRTEPGNRPEGRGLYGGITIAVRRDSDPTVGVAAPERRKDRVDVALRFGEAPTTCIVTEVVGGHPGAWFLRLTK